MWRVVVCDQETSKTRRLKPATWLWKIQPQLVVTPRKKKLTSAWKGIEVQKTRNLFYLNSLYIRDYFTVPSTYCEVTTYIVFFYQKCSVTF
jgi:hypothetical protein